MTAPSNIRDPDAPAPMVETERRDAVRFPGVFEFSYRIRKVLGSFNGVPEGTGCVHDVSDTGFMFRSKKPLARGMILEITASDVPGTLRGGRRLRIVRDEKKGDVHEVGVEFL